MATGRILRISRFCTDDGPGIRSVVFLKGCPLRCLWCHNPESQRSEPEIGLDMGKCVRCGACASVCSTGGHVFRGAVHAIDRGACDGCGACAAHCPGDALTLYGETVDAEAIRDQLVRDRVFFDTTGGGVTVSGGEPVFQADFTADILRLCREAGIHTAMETCGYGTREDFARCAFLCDMVLFDIKETDPRKHRALTGVDNRQILDNLAYLDTLGIPYILRLPLIPGLNDGEAHLSAVRRGMAALVNCQGAEVMPYHTAGVYKYTHLGRDYSLSRFTDATKEQEDAWRRILQITEPS